MNYKEMLEKKDIKVIDNIKNNLFKCKYNNNDIILELNSGLNYNYRLSINGKTIITKGSFIYCINKILNYK